MTLPRIFRRRSRKQLEGENAQQAAEIANLTAECERLTDYGNDLMEQNLGLQKQLTPFMVPLPGEERAQTGKVLN